MLTISEPLHTVMDFSAIFSPWRGLNVDDIPGCCKNKAKNKIMSGRLFPIKDSILSIKEHKSVINL